MDDFDLNDLYAALDAQRTARGLTWAQATREISVGHSRSAHRSIASSTITGLRTKTVAESDGVLQMLRWLQRAPESFLPGVCAEELKAMSLPEASIYEVLRFDTRKLYEALNDRRVTLGLTWQEMALQTRVPASHARGLARGGRTAFPAVMRLISWLGRPAAHFVRKSLV